MSGEWKPFGLFYQLTEIYPGEDLKSRCQHLADAYGANMSGVPLLNPVETERIFLDVVRGMQSIGYGRMIQIVLYEWIRTGGRYEISDTFDAIGSVLAVEDVAIPLEIISRDPAFREDK